MKWGYIPSSEGVEQSFMHSLLHEYRGELAVFNIGGTEFQNQVRLSDTSKVAYYLFMLTYTVKSK
jgi:hypothetical protein